MGKSPEISTTFFSRGWPRYSLFCGLAAAREDFDLEKHRRHPPSPQLQYEHDACFQEFFFPESPEGSSSLEDELLSNSKATPHDLDWLYRIFDYQYQACKSNPTSSTPRIITQQNLSGGCSVANNEVGRCEPSNCLRSEPAHPVFDMKLYTVQIALVARAISTV